MKSVLVWLLFAAIAALVGWAHHSVIDESTRASGTVIATHRPAAIPLASRIIVMQQGRLVLDGERDRVLAALRANAERAAA